MIWNVELTRHAAKDLQRLASKEERRILEFLRDRVAVHPDPRRLGKRLTGTSEETWRFRVGDLRVIARIDDQSIVITVVRVGHRREIYR